MGMMPNEYTSGKRDSVKLVEKDTRHHVKILAEHGCSATVLFVK